MNIYLIGYRGTGKTTVGRMLADLLSWRWIDSDHEIQDRSGSTIAEIFARDGEEGFRDLETEVVRTISHLQNHVVSLGGGAILREENRDLISSSGHTIWLTADAATIAARLDADTKSDDQRPALTNKSGIAEIEMLLDQRRSLYSQLADHQIDTVENSPQEIAQQIYDSIGESD